MTRFAILLGAVLTACTGYDASDAQGGEWSISEMRDDFEFATMSDEEKQAFEQRAVTREIRRKQGLRVCEEGENGTTWTERCKICRCVNGLRSCPAIHCKSDEQKRVFEDILKQRERRLNDGLRVRGEAEHDANRRED